MAFLDSFARINCNFDAKCKNMSNFIERFKFELDFAQKFSELFPDKKDQWQELIIKAANHVSDNLSDDASNMKQLILEAEDMLAPVGKVAKEYTIHCCGHAHIDMNWLWSWPETVNVTYDTFSTMDKLMDEFEDFRFTQSQTSVYAAMQKYSPETFEMIKKRIKEGKWEVVASAWVENDMNMFAGESLCRHMLYTREFFKKNFGLEPEDVKINWSPDTFGHAWTVPSILRRGGVTRYYHMRPQAPVPWLYKWKAPDGSELLSFNEKDDRKGYNGPFCSNMVDFMLDYVKENGAKDFLAMYGVGDHGGGPTRADLRRAQDMMTWPIYPKMMFSTTGAFYDAIEKADLDLPVINSDINFIFEGCYTSESNIKYANRMSEIMLPESETLACIAGELGQMEYPKENLEHSWQSTLFNHFHDILPGSGVRDTYLYAQGRFQDIQAACNTIRKRALNVLSSRVDTSFVTDSGLLGSGFGDGLGAGVGDPGVSGCMTGYNTGAFGAEPLLIYNTKPWERREVVIAKIWNKTVEDNKVIVRDSDGNEQYGQVIKRGKYWDHHYTSIAFEAVVPALGYKVYSVDAAAMPVAADDKTSVKTVGLMDRTNHVLFEYPDYDGEHVIENEYLKITIDFLSGCITHVIDKETGVDYVKDGGYFGALEVCQEVPHDMTAWVIGQISKRTLLTEGGKLTLDQKGPNRVVLRNDMKYNSSSISVEIGINAGSRMIDFKVKTRWQEVGNKDVGVPMLRVLFPVNVEDGKATYEIPFGNQSRKQSEQEIPALKWTDLSSDNYGVTLVNSSKYGHSCADDTLRMTLLRSSYEPDPLPEIHDHEIDFAVICHKGACDVVEATKLGEAFNSPLNVVSTTVHKGDLPSEKSFAEVITSNIFVSAIKKAQSGEGIVVRMFESVGKNTKAQIKISDLVKSDSKAFEVDVLERELPENTAEIKDGVLTVNVPAYGQASVLIK